MSRSPLAATAAIPVCQNRAYARAILCPEYYISHPHYTHMLVLLPLVLHTLYTCILMVLAASHRGSWDDCSYRHAQAIEAQAASAAEGGPATTTIAQQFNVPTIVLPAPPCSVCWFSYPTNRFRNEATASQKITESASPASSKSRKCSR